MNDISRQLNYRLMNLNSDIMSMENDMKRKKELESELLQMQILETEMKNSQEEYKKARYTANKIQSAKKERDNENIDRAMQLATTLVMKGNSVVPRFEYTDGALPEAHLVIEVEGEPLPLHLIEGTGFNEATSLSTLTAILSATDYMKFFFLDEFFSSVSVANTENISTKLNEIFDGKFQVVIVEQKDEIVEHTEHREFLIIYDKEKEESRIETYDVDKFGNRRKVEV